MSNNNKTTEHKNFASIRGDIADVKDLRTTTAGVAVINFSVATTTVDPASGRELNVTHYCALFGDEAEYFAENEARYRSIEVEGPTRPVRFTVMGRNDVSRSEILVSDFRFIDRIGDADASLSRAAQG